MWKKHAAQASDWTSTTHNWKYILWKSESRDYGIFVENNPFTNPPPEVIQQGNEAIQEYFDQKKTISVFKAYVKINVTVRVNSKKKMPRSLKKKPSSHLSH